MIIDNRYELSEKIAKGGMSTIYSGIDKKLNRKVAIKILDTNISRNPYLKNNFINEAHRLAKLESEHIANVYDIGNLNDTFYMVIEYLPGGNLKNMLNTNGKMPPYVVLTVGRTILSALKEIHANNLVHLDIKPENMLIDKDGKVKLIDMGISQDMNDSFANASKETIGTVNYLAPEILDRSSTASPASDLYSLGVTLYELLSNRTPFAGKTSSAVIEAKLTNQTISLNSVVPGVPTELEDLIHTSMQPKPSNRYKSAEQMLSVVNSISTKYNYKPYQFGTSFKSLPKQTTVIPSLTDKMANTSLRNSENSITAAEKPNQFKKQSNKKYLFLGLSGLALTLLSYYLGVEFAEIIN